MKKPLLIILAMLNIQLAVAQVATDSLKTTADTTVKATVVAPEKTRKDTRPFSERVSLGFGSSFWITPNQTYIEVAPILAYRFPKTLITGLGYRYIYRHERVINNDLHSYGPNVFARVNLTRRIYLWTEYEYLNTQYYDNSYVSNEVSRKTDNIDSWFAGLGYVRSLGRKGRGGVSVQVLYNFLYDKNDNNPYYSAFTYRVGYFF